MKRLVAGLSVLFLLATATAMAQQPVSRSATTTATKRPDAKQQAYTSVSPGEVAATPEMWFYEQDRQAYLDPQLAVRRKAEFVAEQRQRRIAAMKWFGFSNQRPQANPDPVHGSYSPGWASNSFYPYQWTGAGRSPYVVVWRNGSPSRVY